MKKLIILLLVLFSTFSSEAQRQWGIVTDSEEFYLLSDVDFLIASDLDATFAIGFKSGGLSAEVQSIRFEYRDISTAVDPVQGEENHIAICPNPVSNTLFVISGVDGDMNIFDSNGIMRKTVRAEDGKNGIYVGDLDPGMYFVRTTKFTVRFLKK